MKIFRSFEPIFNFFVNFGDSEMKKMLQNSFNCAKREIFPLFSMYFFVNFDESEVRKVAELHPTARSAKIFHSSEPIFNFFVNFVESEDERCVILNFHPTARSGKNFHILEPFSFLFLFFNSNFFNEVYFL
ncbi:MAG: hypothetical protein GY820_02160 [Gammaproteobacteria bacterium]|nr:hypothetical protein [Gammaproteobacteria bacterium]